MGKELNPRRFNALKPIAPTFLALGLLTSCGGGAEKNNNAQESKKNESSGYELPFPKGETWFLTGGPHADGFSNGVRYAIDIAPPEGGPCPTDGSRLVIENRVVTASASGEVTIAGDDKNRSDPSHSMIKIKDANGLTEVYVHAANIKVKKGSKVKQGAPLANPSCEYPPGGRNEGAHVHEGLEKDGQAIPIDGVVVGGWTIHNGPENYNGTMAKPGEQTRTADVGRCDTDTKCDGIRNDLPNNSNKAVIAGPKSPIPPISGKANEKSVSVNPSKEKPVEQGWTRFTGNGYQVDYPSAWETVSGNQTPEEDPIFDRYDNFFDQKDLIGLTVISGSLKKGTNLDSLKNEVMKKLKDTSFLEIPNRTLGGQKAWGVDVRTEISNGVFHDFLYLTVKDQKVWGIELSIMSDADYDKNLAILNSAASSFRFTNPTESQNSTPTTKPTETPKPTSTAEKKISLSKKPEDLFKSLLITPIQQADLPAGMVSKGASVGNLDATAKTLNAVGTVNVLITEDDPRFYGSTNGAISYIIFTGSADAKSAYTIVKSSLSNPREIENSKYPTTTSIQAVFGGSVGIAVVQVDNVLIVTALTEFDQANLEPKIMDLTNTALAQLAKAGR